MPPGSLPTKEEKSTNTVSAGQSTADAVFVGMTSTRGSGRDDALGRLGLGQRAGQVHVEHTPAEVAVPIEGPLAGDAGEAARARPRDHIPVTRPMVLAGAGGTGDIVGDDGE